MPFLLKTEPEKYSFVNLREEGETVWDGVTNPQAVKYLREMKPGEKLVIYHSGEERAAMGTAVVASVDASDPKVPVVRIRCGKPIAPRTLAAIKAEAERDAGLFAGSPLLRQGRLSVVPLTDAEYRWLTRSAG